MLGPQETQVKRKRKAPEVFWTDPATGENIRRLTWLEWLEVRELTLKGAKLGLHKPGLWHRLHL